MAGLTPTGFDIATLATLLESLTAELRDKISDKLDLSDRTVLGNVENIFAEHLELAWQVLEEAYNAFDPDNATDDRLVALALLANVFRRGPQKGLVTATLTLLAGQTFAPGALGAHVTGDTSNTWTNRFEVVSTVAGDFEAVFESTGTGSTFVAPAGTLTEISPAVAGWTAITNVLDADPGTDIESIEDLRFRRSQSLAQAGSATVNSITSKLINLDGVLSAQLFENITDDVDEFGVGPHNIRAVVWDGVTPAADNDQIAQVIFDNKRAGCFAQGALVGNAFDSRLGQVPIFFDRVTVVQVFVSVAIVSEVGVLEADVIAALIAEMPSQVGVDVGFNKLACASLIPGVDNFTDFFLSLHPVPNDTEDLDAGQTIIYILDSSNVTVTGDVT